MVAVAMMLDAPLPLTAIVLESASARIDEDASSIRDRFVNVALVIVATFDVHAAPTTTMPTTTMLMMTMPLMLDPI